MRIFNALKCTSTTLLSLSSSVVIISVLVRWLLLFVTIVIVVVSGMLKTRTICISSVLLTTQWRINIGILLFSVVNIGRTQCECNRRQHVFRYMFLYRVRSHYTNGTCAEASPIRPCLKFHACSRAPPSSTHTHTDTYIEAARKEKRESERKRAREYVGLALTNAIMTTT